MLRFILIFPDRTSKQHSAGDLLSHFAAVELKLREVKSFVQGDTARNLQDWDLNSGPSDFLMLWCLSDMPRANG